MSKKAVVKRTISLTNVSQTVTNAQASRCEEQLDEAIYRCLHSLTKRHEPTKEFKAQFSRGAFLKPNTKAFIQVMHYLLNIYDAREFQKRFYWPIFDKAAENAFRTATVEYANSLIEQGKLTGITKIKAHVVVLPGGMKFMKFLLCVIRMVLQEELRKAKGSAADGEVLTKQSIAQMIDRHKRWTQAGSQIHAIVKEEVTLLSKRTEQIERLIETMLADSELAKTITYDKLIQLWAVLIQSQFKERQSLQQRSRTIAKEFEAIIEKAEAKMKKNGLPLPFAKEQLQATLSKVVRQNPDWDPIAQQVFDENGVLQPINLIQLFELALPSVEQFLNNFCFKDQEVIKYEQKELSKVVVKLDGVRQQMDVLQRNLPILDDFLALDLHGNGESPEVAKCDNFAIKNKLFCTPPIVIDFDGHSDGAFPVAGKTSQRLALLNKEDVQLMNARMKLLSTSLYQPRSPRAQQHTLPTKMLSEANPHQSASPNAFAVPRVARREKLNPLTMFNRIKAQSQKHPGGKSAVHSNPSAPVNSTMNISAVSDITMRPEFSSTLLGTPEKPSPTSDANNETNAEICSANHLQVPTQFSHHQPQMPRLANSPIVHSSPRLMALYVGSTGTPKSSRTSSSLLLAGNGGRRTSSAKRDSLVDNVAVHTSPSGRLESLVKQNELIPPCCDIQAGSESKSPPAAEGTADSSEEKTLIPMNGGQLEDLSRTLLAMSLDNQATVISASLHREGAQLIETIKKTNATGSDEKQEQANGGEEVEEDDLFNVSDGILTDIV
ncbi:AGAP003743-PA-like protein [Anopheles sinensis]|uniref:AGAP003743-PA-like protein n=1 Tax=Anopheles sinensis TaxID=74873 RepID=A0A084VZN8_ANOSI|nr:AGAP003743-PA-like protein [Anopheles sinensis]